MKKVSALLLLIGICQCLQAQPWPKVKYSYAVAYLYNLDGKLYGSHKPVKNDKLDTTMVLPGKKLDNTQTAELVKLLSQNTETLNAGLAACYIPHHAVVFYDEKDKIVAWMSACLMCDGVRFYPEKKVNYEKQATKKETARAEAQIKKLGDFFVAAGLTASEKEIDYIELSKHFREGKNTKAEEIVNEDLMNGLMKEYASLKALKKDFAHPEKLVIDSTTKITAGGDKYHFYTVKYLESEFWFSSNGGSLYLDKALIKNEGINVLKDFFIGMTSQESNKKLNASLSASSVKLLNKEKYRNAVFINDMSAIRDQNRLVEVRINFE